mgnify:CR=1 FL=1
MPTDRLAFAVWVGCQHQPGGALGGIGSPLGAVVGGVLIGLAQELSTPFVGFTYKIAIGFVVMLLILLFKPEGLFGGKRRIR